MRIIISPAKKMKADRDSFHWRDLPVFLSETEILSRKLCEMRYEDLKKLWKCNDAITAVNMERLANLNLYTQLTPAILAYEGIQYQYMAPGLFTDREFDYIQEHLRILSGFYGILKPFDGVTPYRLEMQAKLRVGESKDLYDYWGDKPAQALFAETDCIVNLASREYSMCVSKYLPSSVRFITCVFGTEKDGKIVEKGTMCKMARGEMVRFMAENQITDPTDIQGFDRLGYHFDSAKSIGDKFVYISNATKG